MHGKGLSHQKHKAQAAAATPSSASMAAAVPPGAVHIDGSMLEGGGQILRYATALAAITGKPISVTEIRAGRKNPGLSPQHLTGLCLVETMCQGVLGGGQVRSSHITLAPSRLLCGHFLADTGTAGSCTLMVQQALPCMLFAAAPAPDAPRVSNGGDLSPSGDAGSGSGKGRGGAVRADDDLRADALQRWSQLNLRGGTDAAFAPPVGYLEHVLAPTLMRLLPHHISMSVHVTRRGFYPKGGGQVVARARALTAGEALPAFDVTERGRLKEVRIKAFSAGRVQQSDAQRMVAAAAQVLQEALRTDTAAVAYGRNATPLLEAAVGGAASSSSGSGGGGSGSNEQQRGVSIVQDVIREGEATAMGDGGGLLIVAESTSGRMWGASALWERGVPPGSAGKAAAEELLEALCSGSCVDQWMQDQLIIYMALAQGTSKMLCGEPTLHTRTAMVVAETMLPGVKFTVKPLGGSRGGAAGSGGGGVNHSEKDPYWLHLVECQGAGLAA